METTVVMRVISNKLEGKHYPVADYLHQLTTHNRLQADPAFVFSHAPAHMANLRGLLSADLNLPDDFASRITSFIWIGALLGLVAYGPRLLLTTGWFWSVGVLLYLLFYPHVSSFEVLQVILLLPFCVPAKKRILRWKEMVLLFTVPLLPFISPEQLHNRIFLFGLLLFLMGFIAVFWREKLRNSVATS